jgi:hypothetical protein
MLSGRLEANHLNYVGLFIPYQPYKCTIFGCGDKHSNGSEAAVAFGGWLVYVDAGVNLSELFFPYLSLFIIFSCQQIR